MYNENVSANNLVFLLHLHCNKELQHASIGGTKIGQIDKNTNTSWQFPKTDVSYYYVGQYLHIYIIIIIRYNINDQN